MTEFEPGGNPPSTVSQSAFPADLCLGQLSSPTRRGRHKHKRQGGRSGHLI